MLTAKEEAEDRFAGGGRLPGQALSAKRTAADSNARSPLSVMGGKNAGTLEMGRRRYYKLAVPLCRAGRRNPLLLQCKSSRPWCHLSMLCGSWQGTSILKLQLKSTGNAARISAFSMISLDLSRWTKRLGGRLCCTPRKQAYCFMNLCPVPGHCFPPPKRSAIGAAHSASSWYKPAGYKLSISERTAPAKSPQ